MPKNYIPRLTTEKVLASSTEYLLSEGFFESLVSGDQSLNMVELKNKEP